MRKKIRYYPLISKHIVKIQRRARERAAQMISENCTGKQSRARKEQETEKTLIENATGKETVK